jgi:hypothetical protein
MNEKTDQKPFDKFRELAQRVVSVPKKDIDRREAEQKRNKEHRKKAS